jgi:hypothetical protein
MLLVSTPLGSLAIAALAVVGLVAWLVRDRRHPGPRLVGRPPTIDRAALDAAEREVRSGVQRSGDDSGGSRDGDRVLPQRPEQL